MAKNVRESILSLKMDDLGFWRSVSSFSLNTQEEQVFKMDRAYNFSVDKIKVKSV